MKIFYNDSIKHGKNSTLEIKLECSYIVSGMMERGWGKISFPNKGSKCSILVLFKFIRYKTRGAAERFMSDKTRQRVF